MVLPVIALETSPTTEVIRLVRHSTENISNANYIQAAIIRGFSLLTIVRYHIIHNVIVPIVPILSLQFSTLLTLTMGIEVVFNWPGLGQLLVTSLRQQDYSVISGGVILIGALVITINMLSDVLGVMMNSLKYKDRYVFR